MTSPPLAGSNSADDSLVKPASSRGAVSIPRELSHTPGIACISSTMRTPSIQRCRVDRGGESDDADSDMQKQREPQPIEQMVVTFESDGLQLTTASLLGKGGFGHVYAAYSNGGELYAMKVSSKKMSENDWERLRKEVTLMSHFSRHPNVVKMIAAGCDSERAYVVMECCASRSLHDIIAQCGLDVPEILWIGWALVDTVAFLHAKNCIHRDLKPQNLLFDFSGNLKITDFGLSSSIVDAQPRKTVAGTAMYMAPEIADVVYTKMTNPDKKNSLQYGQEVDTWSIGVVLYVMLTRMNPYVQAMETRCAHTMDKTQKTLTLFNAVADAAWQWPKGWSGDAELCEIVNRTLHRDPAKRATLEELQQHTVWNRRPLSCPLSLLQKLNLLGKPSSSRSSVTRRSTSRVQEHAHLPVARRTPSAVIEEALTRVVTTERRARSQLALEHHETLQIIVEMLRLSTDELDCRRNIEVEEKRHRLTIVNHRTMHKPKRRSVNNPTTSSLPRTCAVEGSEAVGRSRVSRQPSVSLVSPSSPPRVKEEECEIVRATPDKFAVVYPGRESSTRWSLRPVVSLPRDLNPEIESFKCMNNHIMTKLTKMPNAYVGFDCNVCDREILKITPETPAFRCYKCDYDLCLKCAYNHRLKDVSFVCVSCAKKFISAAKLQAHSLQCRGPSVSASPRRCSRVNTMLWEEAEMVGGSLLDVRLPNSAAAAPGDRRSTRTSGLSSFMRMSSGGLISTGDSHVALPEDVGKMVVQHRDASFPDVPNFSPPEVVVESRKGATSSGVRKDATRVSRSVSFELPPEVRFPKQDREDKVQPRDSAELKEILEADQPPLKKRRSQSLQKDDNNVFSYEVNSSGTIIGIAARHRVAREGSLLSTEKRQGGPTNVVVIRAENAQKPEEKSRQTRVPRSASASRVAVSAAPSATHSTSKEDAAHRTAASVPPTRQSSARTSALCGGPPLPRRTPGASSPVQKIVPTSNFVVPTQPLQPPPSTTERGRVKAVTSVSDYLGTAGRGADSVSANQVNIASCVPAVGGVGGGGKAYLALPRDEHNRIRFVEDFLSGGWVRFYSFTKDDVVVMYYCLQPGRYGAMFATEAGFGTAVVDVYSKLVLYVPCVNNDGTNRSQPHPHVQTFFEEEVRLLSISEAKRYLDNVLNNIMDFVREITRLRAEGLTPAAVHAAYIYQRDKNSVPPNTKFVYVRKVFPDPSGSFTLFRLSNLRSQVVCNTLMDIRWQSDRRNNVGQKYYVLADGTTEPFVVDHTGILSQVERVLCNNFRR
ncbi:Protein tyrosine kinase Protein kinase domain [Trypanosoma vivax]|uniref:Serine/threonine-protein kinase PLK n=1 Tax=Trypanosoma vivax (strain Y486) TaxID=1055687 RepID=G0UCU6_TRYVY|nr:putative tyrosine kinase [Trypanosoma vivax]KAH8607819.1 Protein tyrosine kinase Protein kinase domain [Trypanosoma vivax]CCC53656.1 putative tyrosine kinase [Trypanosoma vivax Y486]